MEAFHRVTRRPAASTLAQEPLPLLANILDIGVVASPPPAGAPLAGASASVMKGLH